MARFRSAYDVPLDVPFFSSEDSVTKQCFKDECDINLIMKRADHSGFLDHVSASNPLYLDLSDVEGYKESLDFVVSSQEAFMSLPASLRARFHNDPAAFMEFASDPANSEELMSLGVVDVSQEPEATSLNSTGENLSEASKPPEPAVKK